MLDADGEVKIIDLGLATKYLSKEYERMTDRVGTLYSMAPQVLEGDYNYKCDIWSVGVVAYMMLSGGISPLWGPPRPMPWAERRKLMIKRIKECNYMRMNGPSWEKRSKKAKDFVTALLVLDPQRRPSAEEAMQLPWIRDAPAFAASPTTDAGKSTSSSNDLLATDSLERMLAFRRKLRQVLAEKLTERGHRRSGAPQIVNMERETNERTRSLLS